MEPDRRLASAEPLLSRTAFAALPGWDEDDHAAAYRAFMGGGRGDSPVPKTRALGIEAVSLHRLARFALAQGPLAGGEAKRFFEQHFVPHRLVAEGFVTGYFEPELAASRNETDVFQVPLYRRPPDLVEVTESTRPPGWDPELRFARKTARGLEPYSDRAAIEAGALRGRGLELAWLADHVDAFFVHVQGSARLRLVQGGTLRVGFDGKSGHPYTSIGKLAVARGLLPLDGADKDGLEAWLKSRPEPGRALMRENRSFIFFRAMSVGETEGPVGAAGVPLTAGRSLAVDRTLHTFGTPVWVEASGLADPDRPERSFQRLLVAQDTGSAIIGPARGDLFIGSGRTAGHFAGRVRHAAAMTLLLPARARPPS